MTKSEAGSDEPKTETETETDRDRDRDRYRNRYMHADRGKDNKETDRTRKKF